MTDNEKLIEEARRAVGIAKDSIWRTSPDPDGDTQHEAVLDRMLAVFEAAHTPTDDEREALGAAWDDGNAVGLDGWVGPGRGTEPVDDHAVQKREETVAKLAAGFRRPEVPEPSAEKPDIEYRGSAESDNWVLAISGASNRDIETARRENERLGWQKYRVLETEPEPEPQGEPSDAQVQAAGAVLYENWGSFDFDDPADDWERGIYDLVRAALRAAGGAR